MKASEIKGKVVITVPGGGIVGTVDDVLFHSMNQCVGALVIKSERFTGTQIVLAKDISSIGGDAVTIESVDRIRDQTRFDVSQQMVSAGDALGWQVATVSGDYVGKLSDIHVSPETRKIVGFEVTGGLFARMFGHTHTIEMIGHTHLGKDLLIVDDVVVQNPDEAAPPQ